MEFVTRTRSLDRNHATDYSLLGGKHLERGRRLFTTGLIVLGVALGALVYTADVATPLHLIQGLVIFTLSLLPALFWAKTGGSRFPVFEATLLLCANAYAMPMVKAREQLEGYSHDVITLCGWIVIAYLVAANVVYRITGGTPGKAQFWRESLITPRLEKMIVNGMAVAAIYTVISTFTTWVPSELYSVLRAVFFGLGILCSFVSAQRWGRGEMTGQEKFVFIASLLVHLTALSVGLILAEAISMIGIALLGYLSGGQRVPWIVIAITFAILAVLHTGKTRMREKYWEQELPAPTISEVPAYYTEWFEFGLQPTSGGKTAAQKMIERTSLMHMLCLVANQSPERRDFLYGSTYRHVLPQLIPRFFWPDKPRSHIATYELAIYYGLQAEEDTSSTTIAFGLLTEAYANFGLLGAIALGALWGFWLKKMQIWSAFSPMFSFAGLLMILLTAWAFSAEMTMAVWVSSLQQAVFVVLGIPLLLRSLFGR